VTAKILNTSQKVYFTLVLFLLTDANDFRHFVNFLSRKVYIRHAINFFTGIPINEAGSIFRAWSREVLSLSLDITFWFILFVVIVRPRLRVKIGTMLWRNAAVITLLILAGSSWFWSIEPAATLNGTYLAIKITLVGIYLSQVYSLEDILDLLVWIVALASMFSILAVWLMPELSIGQYGWLGVYSAKNSLGRLMAFGNAMLVIYWFRNRGAIFKRILALFFFILTGVLLVFSDSVTSLITLLGMYAALIFYNVWKRWIAQFKMRTQVFIAVLGVGIGALLVSNYEFVFMLVNRSPTLTGRITLWHILWTWFEKRPLFGFGYHAFWTQISEPLLGWGRHAHNGYFEIALGLGLLGLIVFLVALIVTWKRAFAFFRQKEQISFFWPILAMVYLTLANVTYSIAFENPDFHWVLFIIIAGVVTSDRLPERSPSRHISDKIVQEFREPGNLP
jgi:O-antigen ligase